jgi:hypothetical protein
MSPFNTFLVVFAVLGLSQQVFSFAILPNAPSPTQNNQQRFHGNVQSQSHANGRHLKMNMLSSESEHSNPDHDQNDSRIAEFVNLEPIEESDVRRQRRLQETEIRQQFVPSGDKLWDLRLKLDKLSHRLLDAIYEEDPVAEARTRKKLHKLEQQDPELVYKLELMEMKDAAQEGRDEDAAQHRAKALAARSCLPQFNLDGLWIGKYGSHGYEMVNVTYVGDTLIARKVTGDKNVPRGEITFQADLHPLRYNDNIQIQSDVQQNNEQNDSQQPEPLEPISLTERAARKWGTRQLPRYAGLGLVAEDNFSNSQWMDGQVIIIGDDYFSFAWIPIEQQIFFGRPSPELALKMLRESGNAEFRGHQYSSSSNNNVGAPPPPPSITDNVEIQKDFAVRCLQVTDELTQDELVGDSFGCIWSDGVDVEGCYFE